MVYHYPHYCSFWDESRRAPWRISHLSSIQHPCLCRCFSRFSLDWLTGMFARNLYIRGLQIQMSCRLFLKGTALETGGLRYENTRILIDFTRNILDFNDTIGSACQWGWQKHVRMHMEATRIGIAIMISNNAWNFRFPILPGVCW